MQKAGFLLTRQSLYFRTVIYVYVYDRLADAAFTLQGINAILIMKNLPDKLSTCQLYRQLASHIYSVKLLLLLKRLKTLCWPQC